MRETEYAVYQDVVPFVRRVRWEHPRIRAAMRALAPGWRSVICYSDWRAAYRLEDDAAGGDEARRDARVRNFIRVLLGEYRDHPRLLEAKLGLLARQSTPGPRELSRFDANLEPFGQLSYPAYRRLVGLMGAVLSARREALVAEGLESPEGGRAERSVPPWTHAELLFACSRSLTGATAWPATFDLAQYERELSEHLSARAARASSAAGDWMYTFRGHKLITPLWLESNAFIWASRRGARALANGRGAAYYAHPFQERYRQGRAAWGAYLFYPEEHHAAMRQAREEGGGPILYLTDQDATKKGFADYRLFAGQGAGESTGLDPDPTKNANMVAWELAASTPSTTGAVAGWRPELAARPDMGFFELFPSLEARRERLYQALDRHTNWGPTGYYMIDASRQGAPAHEIPYMGAYSPLVATSYDIAESDEFATGDYWEGFESGLPKWMHVVRLRRADYYDERDLRAARPLDFDRHYLNETSLSNNWHGERGLDKFGWVPEEDLGVSLYLPYGARGEEPPALVDIPPGDEA